MQCHVCNTEFEGNFCPNCGTAPDGKRTCPHCGAKSSGNFCSSCGMPLSKEEPKTYRYSPQEAYQPPVIITNTNTNTNIVDTLNKSPKSKGTAAFLCLFFGFLGAHRFYVGKIGTGILFLCSFGGFFLGAFLDFLTILFGNFTDSQGRVLY